MSIFDQICSVVASDFVDGPTVNPQYQPPQQRTWVGLNLDERSACYEKSGGNLSKFANAIEAKLKEKNNG